MEVVFLVLLKSLLFLLCAAVVLLAIALFLMWPGRRRTELTGSFLGHWYAHRGFHDNNSPNAPENSLYAFRKAVENGYGIELDVQLTKDDRVVVFHDNGLKRICGVDAPVNSLTFDELQELRLLETDERIPLFSDVLKVIDGKVPVIVEIKMVDSNIHVCEKANELLKDYKGLYCIESFHPMAVRWFMKNRPELMRGQLSSNFRRDGEDEKFGGWLVHQLLTNVACRPDFIAYSCKATDNPGFRICTKLLGALPVAWTITSPECLINAKNDFKIFIFEGFKPEEVKLKD